MSIQNKITSVVLQAIRSRRRHEETSPTQANSSAMPKATLREASFSDFKAVATLKHRWGLAADSYENWQRLWQFNPALATGPEHPMGWVLEAEGEIVGYIGNVCQRYHYRNRVLKAATAHALVVEPRYRVGGVSLVAAYFRQRGIDLFISTGAIAPVGKIARAFKTHVLKQPEYATVYFWVLRSRGFSRALMNKIGLGTATSLVFSGLASLVLSADNIVSRRRPTEVRTDFTITKIRISQIGNSFQDLWERKLRENSYLIADRSPDTLRWHFNVPGDKGAVRAFCCHKSGQLVGYAVVRHEAPEDSDLRKSAITDLLAQNDDPSVIRQLFCAVFEDAKAADSHVLEVVGFPHQVRQSFLDANPYRRQYPTPIFGYKANN
jgi:hypothetical protein